MTNNREQTENVTDVEEQRISNIEERENMLYEREKEMEEREKQIKRMEMEAVANEILAVNEMSTAFRPFVIRDTREETEKAVCELKCIFESEVNKRYTKDASKILVGKTLGCGTGVYRDGFSPATATVTEVARALN